jgi:hypothetical protein
VPPSNFKGNVRPPIEIPQHVVEARKGVRKNPEVKVPLLIQIFTWFCVFRCVVFLAFGLTVGTAPESVAAAFVVEHFDSWSKQASPEAVFYILAAMYGFIAFRWLRRDWKARWGTMFICGSNGIKTIIDVAADRAAGTPLIPGGIAGLMIMGALFNLMISAYVAFYPGMEQAFSESEL